MNSRRRSCVGCFTILLFLLNFIIVSRAQEYVEISGTIDLYHFELPGTNNPPEIEHDSPVSFVVTVGTNEWRVDNDFSQNAEVKWLFDGTNVFRSDHITKQSSLSTREAAKRIGLTPVPFEEEKTNLSIQVFVTPYGHPLGNLGVNVPWLAFCSGTYLKHAGRIIPPPVSVLQHSFDAFAYSDKTETFDDEFGLPRKIDLFTSQSLFKTSATNRYLDVNPKYAAKISLPLFPDSLLKFHYEVTESTNFLGWHFPTRFEYYQNDYFEKGEWTMRSGGVGRVTAIRKVNKPRSLFDTQWNQTVVDLRFQNRAERLGGISYPSSNSYLAPTNDVRLQKILAAKINRLSASSSPFTVRSRVRLAFLVFLLISIFLPLAALLRRPKS
jgi:hypothetical protein